MKNSPPPRPERASAATADTTVGSRCFFGLTMNDTPPTVGGRASVDAAAPHRLACDDSIVIDASPSIRSSRALTHGSGDATPGAPAQAGTYAPLRYTAIVCAFSRAGTRLTSTRNVITSGLPAVWVGAEISICWPPRNEKVRGASSVSCSSLIEMAPPAVDVTHVSTGSLLVAPSPSVSVVTVPPGDATALTSSAAPRVMTVRSPSASTRLELTMDANLRSYS